VSGYEIAKSLRQWADFFERWRSADFGPAERKVEDTTLNKDAEEVSELKVKRISGGEDLRP
jgi:hypothetical protein